MNKLFLLTVLAVSAPVAQAAQNSVTQGQIEKIKENGMKALDNAGYCNYVRIPAAGAFLGLWGAGIVLRRLPLSTVTKVASVTEYTMGFTQLFASIGYFENIRKAKECAAAIKCLEKIDTLAA